MSDLDNIALGIAKKYFKYEHEIVSMCAMNDFAEMASTKFAEWVEDNAMAVFADKKLTHWLIRNQPGKFTIKELFFIFSKTFKEVE